MVLSICNPISFNILSSEIYIYIQECKFLRCAINLSGINRFVVGSQNVQLAADVVALSLKIAVSSFCNQADSTEKVASAVFPFLLIQPKVLSRSLYFLHLWKKDCFDLR